MANSTTLTDLQLQLIAARTLLQPGEVTVYPAELDMVSRLYAAWISPASGPGLQEKLGHFYRGEPLGRDRSHWPDVDSSSSDSEEEAAAAAGGNA